MQGALFHVFVLILTMLIASTSNAAKFPTDLVYDTGKEIPETYRHFTQVMGSGKLIHAEQQYECFKKTNPHIPVGLIAFPKPLLHGSISGKTEYPRPRFPYSIVVASYAAPLEAQLALSATREKVKLNALFECLHFEKSDESKEAFKNQFYAFEISTIKKDWPRLLKRSQMPKFDAISYTRNLYSSAQDKSATINAVVKRKIYTDKEQVKADLSGVQSIFPELHFASIRQGKYYFLTAGANTSDDMLKEAILQMRRRGLYEFTFTAKISSEISENTEQTPPVLIGLPGQKTEFDITPTIKSETHIDQISILEMEDLATPIQDRVENCIKQIKPPSSEGGESKEDLAKIVPGIPLDKFSSCAGLVLDNVGITRCLLESDCAGLRVPINWDIDPATIARNCILAPGLQCAGTTLDPVYVELARNAHIEICFNNPTSEECTKIKSSFVKICKEPENKLLCENNITLAQSIEVRTKELLECISDGHCHHIAPRPADIEETVKNELASINHEYEKAIRPAKEGLAFLSRQAKELSVALNYCKKIALTNRKESEVCYAKLALSPAELEALECYTKSDQKNLAKCFIKDPKINDFVTKAECLKDSEGNPVELAKCAGLEEAAELEEKYKCAIKEPSALSAIGKCSNVIPPAVTETLTCVSESGDSPTKLAGCIPGQTPESKAVTCLATSENDSERMTCLTDAIPLDPNTKKALSCVATSNGDTQAAARCALGDLVPGDLGKALACGSTATGAVDFALCVAGPQMNAELRMAAECAASTGGEPVSFATCTAGRLTVAELTKCMSGEIGREGGCFGPNNTIVKTLTNAFEDMVYGLGENNDITIAYRQLEEIGKQINDAITDFGRNVGNEIDSLRDNFRRSDIGRVVCTVPIC